MLEARTPILRAAQVPENQRRLFRSLFEPNSAVSLKHHKKTRVDLTSNNFANLGGRENAMEEHNNKRQQPARRLGDSGLKASAVQARGGRVENSRLP